MGDVRGQLFLFFLLVGSPGRRRRRLFCPVGLVGRVGRVGLVRSVRLSRVVSFTCGVGGKTTLSPAAALSSWRDRRRYR